MLITLTGLCRFQVIEELPMTQPYRRALVSYAKYRRDMDVTESSGFKRQELFAALQSYLDMKELDTDWKSLEKISDESLVSSLAMMCPFEPSEKQALLEADTLAQRGDILTLLMQFADSPFTGDEPPAMQ
jgi:Lon protease-like protein